MLQGVCEALSATKLRASGFSLVAELSYKLAVAKTPSSVIKLNPNAARCTTAEPTTQQQQQPPTFELELELERLRLSFEHFLKSKAHRFRGTCACVRLRVPPAQSLTTCVSVLVLLGTLYELPIALLEARGLLGGGKYVLVWVPTSASGLGFGVDGSLFRYGFNSLLDSLHTKWWQNLTKDVPLERMLTHTLLLTPHRSMNAST